MFNVLPCCSQFAVSRDGMALCWCEKGESSSSSSRGQLWNQRESWKEKVCTVMQGTGKGTETPSMNFFLVFLRKWQWRLHYTATFLCLSLCLGIICSKSWPDKHPVINSQVFAYLKAHTLLGTKWIMFLNYYWCSKERQCIPAIQQKKQES